MATGWNNLETGVKSACYEFADLRPVRRLPSGTSVYDRTSFPGIVEVERVESIPTWPHVVVVDDLTVQDPASGYFISLGRQSILTFHGISTPQMWRQAAPPGCNVEEIATHIERQGIPIDALLVCNPGNYRLPETPEGNKWTYGLGNPIMSGFKSVGGRLSTYVYGPLMLKGQKHAIGAARH